MWAYSSSTCGIRKSITVGWYYKCVRIDYLWPGYVLPLYYKATVSYSKYFGKCYFM